MAVLDRNFFPHIFDSIVAFAPHDSLVRLRSTSRDLLGLCDKKLAKHIRVVVVKCPCPGGHHQYHICKHNAFGLRGVNGKRIPGRNDVESDRAQDFKKGDILRRRNLHSVETVDVFDVETARLIPFGLLFNLIYDFLDMSPIGTFRFSIEAAFFLFDVEINPFPGRSIVFLDLNQLPSLRDREPVNCITVPELSTEMIINVTYDLEQPLYRLHWGGDCPRAITLILSHRGEVPNLESPAASQFVDDLLNFVVCTGDNIDFPDNFQRTVVGLPHQLPGIKPEGAEKFKTNLNARLVALSNSDGYACIDILKFMTMDEYRASIPAEQFHLETVMDV